MAEARVEDEIAADADRVWEVVRDFGGIQRWSPQMTSCETEGDGVGAVRTIELGGAVVRERLERLDDGARSLSYSILEAPLPATGYLATMTVAAAGPGRSKLTWSSSFEPVGIPAEQLVQLFESIYRGGIEGLRRLL